MPSGRFFFRPDDACEHQHEQFTSSTPQQEAHVATPDKLVSFHNIMGTDQCAFFIASSSMYIDVSFLPMLSWISKYFATHRSRQTASPLVMSPSRYLGGMHFVWQACVSLRNTMHARTHTPHTHTHHTHTRTHRHTHRHTHARTHRHAHIPLDHWTPIARGDDSDATAEAIAACAGIAPFNSLQG